LHNSDKDTRKMAITRREFIRQVMALGLAASPAAALFSAMGCGDASAPAETLRLHALSETTPASTPSPVPSPSSPTSHPSTLRLVVARGARPADVVQAAVKALGGIERFVKPDNNVIIKPNICVASHTYEYAATTNPEVVGTLVSMCRAAGARRVRVMDQPFSGTAEAAYARSGIAEAVRTAGGEMEIMSRMKYREVAIPRGRSINRWSIYSDVLDADVLINVPIAKHHNMARLTLGMKNLMGVIQDRAQFHFDLAQRIADLNTVIRPTLTIIDGVRILVNHGPTGGNLSDVKLTNTIIASEDIVAADSCGATLFGLTGADIPAVRTGAEMGLGMIDLHNIRIEEVNL
jgi:uncharacterized protein (DUF362 family)